MSSDKPFTEGVEYSDALRVQMNDLDRKLKSAEYAEQISRGKLPEQLLKILQYAVENSAFYSLQTGFSSLQDFPVMNRESLNEHYDEIAVHAFDNVKTHKMYTSGSTGVPFTIVQDLAKRERNIADLKYYWNLAGYTDHDSMCYLRARPAASIEQQKKDNIWQLESSSLSEKNLVDYFHVIVEKKCTALIGYASTLEIAIDYWNNHFENETQVKTIISHRMN
jgi:phenylacetate-CoA ligase